jgi:hypothetical protein
MPEQDAVLAVTSQSPDMQKSLNIIWDNLLPGMQTGVLPENKEEQSGLKKELGALMLPVVKGSVSSSMSSGLNKKKWKVADNDLGVGTLELSFSGKGCVLSAVAGGKDTKMEFGWESWVLNSPREAYVFRTGQMVPMPSRIAGTATWINEHTLQLNVRFVEAIFGDRITLVFDGDSLSVSFLNSVDETAVKKNPDPRKPLSGKMG